MDETGRPCTLCNRSATETVDDDDGELDTDVFYLGVGFRGESSTRSFSDRTGEEASAIITNMYVKRIKPLELQ